MNQVKLVLAGFLLSMLIYSCESENKDSENYTINKWVYSNMKDLYFWNTSITENDAPVGSTNPDEYFESLLNKPSDKWSFMVENFPEFEQSMAGSPTSMGYEPVFGQFSQTGNVFGIVKYVYPNSPADQAGLERGNIILKINGTELTENNLEELFSLESYTLTLGEYRNNSINITDDEIEMTASTLEINPVISENIFSENGKNIGYFALTEFISETSFIEKVEPTILNFKENNIKDLIIDLRYNTGGDLNSAIWLGSVLAPYNATASNNTFVKLIFNQTLQPILDDRGESSYPFSNLPDLNLDLNTIYFLTTNFSTASASELVICGLEPYMDVIQIGENTIGKYQGMSVIPHTDKYWAILPVIFKYANVDDYTDFADGLTPDYPIEDNLIEAFDLGDINDPMIAKAIELIAGLPARKTSNSSFSNDFSYVYSSQQKLKMNVYK